MTFAPISNVYGQEIERGPDGEYIFSEQAFIDFWNYQKKLEADIKAKDKRIKDLEDQSEDKDEVIDGLIKKNKKCERKLDDNVKKFNPPEVIIISGGVAVVVGFIVYVFAR